MYHPPSISRFPLAPTLALTLLTGCSTLPNAEKQAAMADDARKTADGLLQSLSGELKAAMSASVPVEAIAVCKVKARLPLNAHGKRWKE